MDMINNLHKGNRTMYTYTCDIWQCYITLTNEIKVIWYLIFNSLYYTYIIYRFQLIYLYTTLININPHIINPYIINPHIINPWITNPYVSIPIRYNIDFQFYYNTYKFCSKLVTIVSLPWRPIVYKWTHWRR